MQLQIFSELFNVLEDYLSIIGLSQFYLRKGTKSRRYAVMQKILFVFAFCQEIPIWIGEFVYGIFAITSGHLTDAAFLDFAEVMPCVIFCTFAVAKVSRLLLKRETVWRLIDDFEKLWPKGDDFDEETPRIVNESINTTIKLCSVYSLFTVITAVVYGIWPLIIMTFNYFTKGEYTFLLPFMCWYPYDYKTNVWVWIVTFVSQAYGGIFTTAAVVSADSLFALMTVFVSLHLQLLCRDIKNISVEDGLGLSSQEKLQNAVNLHNKLITLCQDIENVFGPMILLNLLGSSFLICVLLFSLTIAPFYLLIKYTMVTASALVQIFMLALYANAIVDESCKVAEATYDSPWMDVNGPEGVHYKKAVIIMMSRSQRALKISALGFTDISMETFATILKASFSYFTLLRTVYQKNST